MSLRSFMSLLYDVFTLIVYVSTPWTGFCLGKCIIASLRFWNYMSIGHPGFNSGYRMGSDIVSWIGIYKKLVHKLLSSLFVR